MTFSVLNWIPSEHKFKLEKKKKWGTWKTSPKRKILDDLKWMKSYIS